MRCVLQSGHAAGGLVVAAVVLTAAALASPGATERVAREGGTFRVALPAGSASGVDPALIGDLLDPACGALMNYPDKRLPEGLRLRPELAEANPIVSRDGRTYTFTIRKDARFSTGARVTAADFAHSLERMLSPGMGSPFSRDFINIVGAKRMRDGKTAKLAGVIARGRTLTVRLTKPVPDLPTRMRFCVVPGSLPADPEGARAPLPSPAPYYVAQYVPGERVVLERNRFYRGKRPHHVARFDVDLASNPATIIDEIASGRVEYGRPRATEWADRAAELAQRYGVNKSRYFVVPGLGLRMFVINTSRPLFRNNPRLRQAVNFAVDRRALTRELGAYAGRATDQYLLPVTPGFRDERIYPLKGPDLKRARALATGRRRGRRAILYTPNLPLPLAAAQIVQRNLKAIGLEVRIEQFPAPVAFAKMSTPGEPFDLGYIGWFRKESREPSFLHWLFDGRTIADAPDFGNWSYFNSPKYNRLLEQAARLSGAQRYRVYGELDVQLSRDAAPAIPFAAINETSFVSANVGCIVLNPSLDLTAVCLK
jgi:peptide/nickel transport system substrate-binding protein